MCASARASTVRRRSASIVLLPVDGARSGAPTELDAVLAHERAHVRSRDCHWPWLAQLARRRSSGSTRSAGGCSAASKRSPKPPATMRSSPRVTIPSPTPQLLLDFARHPNSRRVAMSVADSNVPARIERILARTPPAAALPRFVRWTAFAAADSRRRARGLDDAGDAVPQKPAAPAAAPVPTPTPIHVVGVRAHPTRQSGHLLPGGRQARESVRLRHSRGRPGCAGAIGGCPGVESAADRPRNSVLRDAALQVARNTTFGNTSQQVGSLKFMVKFELKH